MQEFKQGLLPFRHEIPLSQYQCSKTPEEKKHMQAVPYALAMCSLMYTMLCTKPNICFTLGIMSRYQLNSRLEHQTTVKYILLRRTRNYMLVFQSDELIPRGYTNSNFQSNKDSRLSTSNFVFTFTGTTISWRTMKQSCNVDSTMELIML